MRRPVLRSFLALVVCAVWGCGPAAEPETPAARPAESELPGEIPSARPAAQELPPTTTEEGLKAALKEKNPRFEGEVGIGSDGPNIMAMMINDPAIQDLSPLAGLALRQLDLTGCHVSDVSALRGMPLTLLYLGETGVRDIGALSDMPLGELFLDHTEVDDLSPLKDAQLLQKLNLEGARVKDLGPLRGMRRLEMLWLTGCPVSDLGPLAEVPSLVSLTIAKTEVSDLSPLKGHPSLQRLHIAESGVTDLSALQWMKLTRLIFTPRRIRSGIEFARQAETLSEIDVAFPSPSGRPMSPAEFWRRYDAGEFQ